MKVQMYNEQRIDLTHSYFGESTSLRIKSEKGISVDFFTYEVYMEVRKKGNQIKTFYFPRKSVKKDFDFGWWEDAEVVYSNNEVEIK